MVNRQRIRMHEACKNVTRFSSSLLRKWDGRAGWAISYI